MEPKQNYTNKHGGGIIGYVSNSYIYLSTDYDKNVKQTREYFGKKKYLCLYIPSWLSIPSGRNIFKTEIMFR